MPFERIYSRRRMAKMLRDGHTEAEVAAAIGCKPRLVRKIRKMLRLTGQRGKPWPDALWKRCCELQESGAGVTEIARTIGKTVHSVYRKLEREGRAKYKSRRTRSRARRMNAEQLLRMKMPRELVAERTGYTVKTIRRFERELREKKIQPPTKEPHEDRMPTLNPAGRVPDRARGGRSPDHETDPVERAGHV